MAKSTDAKETNKHIQEGVQNENQQTKKKCFVITPAGSDIKPPSKRHIDGIIDGVLLPVLESDYEVIIPHRQVDIGPITKSILKHIYSSDLVIANLTGLNPNVMYELAFRHSVGKPVIIIIEKGTPFPFDVSDERMIVYEDDAKGVIELTETLEHTLECLNLEEERKNIIYDAISEELNGEKIIKDFKLDKKNIDALPFILSKLNKIEDSLAVKNTVRNNYVREMDNRYSKLNPDFDKLFRIGRNGKMLQLAYTGRSSPTIKNKLLEIASEVQNEYPFFIKSYKVVDDNRIELMLLLDDNVDKQCLDKLVFEIRQKALEKNIEINKIIAVN